MAAYLDLFTPETWQAFVRRGCDVSGFRVWGKVIASKIKPDDVLICYVVGLGRWIGALRVLSNAYEDSAPYFVEQEDPFVIRFKVEPIVTLEPVRAIPIRDIWDKLPMCQGVRRTAGFTYKVGLQRRRVAHIWPSLLVVGTIGTGGCPTSRAFREVGLHTAD